MEDYRKIIEDYNEGGDNIRGVDELIQEIRLDEEFVNASRMVSIIDTYQSRLLKKLEIQLEEQKELEHIIEADLDKKLQAKIEDRKERIKIKIKKCVEEMKLKDKSFYSSKLSNFDS